MKEIQIEKCSKRSDRERTSEEETGMRNWERKYAEKVKAKE